MFLRNFTRAVIPRSNAVVARPLIQPQNHARFISTFRPLTNPLFGTNLLNRWTNHTNKQQVRNFSLMPSFGLPRSMMGARQRNIDTGRIRLKQRSERIKKWKYDWKRKVNKTAARRIRLTRFGWQHLKARSAMVDFRKRSSKQMRRILVPKFVHKDNVWRCNRVMGTQTLKMAVIHHDRNPNYYRARQYFPSYMA